MVFIADYGAGNLRSVLKAFEYLGIKAIVSVILGSLSVTEKLFFLELERSGRL